MIDMLIAGGIMVAAVSMNFYGVISIGDAMIIMVLAMILHKIKE